MPHLRSSDSAGRRPPLHRHDREDEIFYILEGRFKFSIDGKMGIAERAAFACAPRGSIHAFHNIGESTGVLHMTCIPAGIEIPCRAVRMPSPKARRQPLSPDQVVAEFAKHGIAFHCPPLTGE